MNETKTEAPLEQAGTRRQYTVAECLFAWACVAAGYAFWRVFPVSASPLGGLVFVTALFAVTATVLLIGKKRLPAMAWVTAASAVVLCGSLVLCDEPLFHHLSYLYAMAAYAYFLFLGGGHAAQSGASDWLLFDLFRAVCILPFCTKGFVFFAMFSGKAKKGGKVLGLLCLGIVLAFVPTVAVLLLLSYDSEFLSLLRRILDVNVWDILSHTASLLFGVPIGMYLFAMFTADVDGSGSHILTHAHGRKAIRAVRIAPSVTVAAATLPLLAVYAVFFVSQWQYYVSGFTGVLPSSFSYASYAREGFFQLCAVAVINLLMILTAIVFTKRREDKPSWLLRVLVPLYSAATLVLIATAVAKMIMYIDTYGLTQKRVYATWFMGVLAVVFVILAVRQFVPRFKALFASAAVCVVMLSVLALGNVNGLIATYNTDRAIDGELSTADVQALEDLGDAAVPSLVRLYKEHEVRGTLQTPHARQVLYALSRADARLERDSDVWSFTLPRYHAKQALASLDTESMH